MAFFDPSVTPSPDEVNKIHTNSDVDKSRLSQHHTLGTSATQASPGNHNHDGISSVKVKVTDLDGTITAANGLPAGGLADQVLTKIDGTDYNVEWSDATAITTTANLIKHYVKNDSGTTLAKGTVVYVSGADGTNILVKPALATGDATTATTLGFLAQSLANNAHGYVVSEGLLTGLNTSTASAGDPIWLSGTTAGGVIYGLANEPHAPVHIVYLGTVTRSNSNNGEIFVKVNNGWELQELHNVDALTPSNGDLLKYDSATSLWKNAAQSTLTIAPSQVTGTAVITTDSRLSDARTPTAHASTHASAGSDPITIAPSQVTGTAVITTDSRLSDARTPLSHTHGNISNTGTVSTSVTATNPVKVLITDTSNTVGTLTTTGASNTTFLRGDGTWATPSGGGGGGGGISGFSGTGYSGVTSTSSNSIGTGSKTFSVASTGAFLVGDIVRIINNTSTNNHWMQGTITALTTNSSITVNVTSVGSGTGTYTSWLIGVTNITGTSATGIDNQISPNLNILSGSSTATSGGLTAVSGNIVIKTGTATSDLTGAGGTSNPGSVFIESGEAVYDSENGGANLGKVYVGTGNTGEIIIGKEATYSGAQVVRIMPRTGSDTKTLSLADNGGTTTITLGANASAATIRFGVNSTSSATYHNGKNFFWQPAPTAVTGGTTTTVAALQTFILTTTSTSGTITLPTFANMSTINSTADTGFDWVLINTAASGSVTIAGNTSHTIVGSTSVAFGTSAKFRSVYRGSSVVTYRIR